MQHAACSMQHAHPHPPTGLQRGFCSATCRVAAIAAMGRQAGLAVKLDQLEAPTEVEVVDDDDNLDDDDDDQDDDNDGGSGAASESDSGPLGGVMSAKSVASAASSWRSARCNRDAAAAAVSEWCDTCKFCGCKDTDPCAGLSGLRLASIPLTLTAADCRFHLTQTYQD